jgi:hypothetical protein
VFGDIDGDGDEDAVKERYIYLRETRDPYPVTG